MVMAGPEHGRKHKAQDIEHRILYPYIPLIDNARPPICSTIQECFEHAHQITGDHRSQTALFFNIGGDTYNLERRDEASNALRLLQAVFNRASIGNICKRGHTMYPHGGPPLVLLFW